MSEDNGRVSVRTGEGLRTTIDVAGKHELVADEPASYGGTDAGPTPYDYLLGALGSCTATTVRMYADRKGWPLEGVRVSLEHGRIHARDCEECESTEGRLDRIEMEIELEGPLEEAQRDRLIDIAGKCPVHRTLDREVVISARARADLA